MGKRNIQPNREPGRASGASRRRHLAALGLDDRHAYADWCRAQGFGPSEHKTWRQRRRELAHARRLAGLAAKAQELTAHLDRLGLASPDDYARWRRARGFDPHGGMGPARRKREFRAVCLERAGYALIAARRARRSARQRVAAVMACSSVRPEAEPRWAARLRDALAYEKDARTRAALERLGVAALDRSHLLTGPGARLFPHLGWGGDTCVFALLALARRHPQWARQPEDWKPEGRTARRQFGSLARHLLCRYSVPRFLDCVWFEGDYHWAKGRQDWFIHIGQGQNIRAANIPIPLTKMGAHCFLQAPGDYDPIAAMRWGQARGMGGSDRLARALASTFLRVEQPDEAFWAGVIQWFVQHPELDTDQVGPIVDYIYHLRYAPQEIELPDGEIEYGSAREPNFAVQGRSPAALLRRVEEWHAELARESRLLPREWNALGIEGYAEDRSDEMGETQGWWTIRELLRSKDLEAEGNAMNNCVASYAKSCEEGKSSIWSLRLTLPSCGEERSVMTIEVDPETRAIVQARGKNNVTPGAKKCPNRLKIAPRLLRQWASQTGLRVAPDAW